LGFAVCDPTTGKIHIPEEQLGLIGNFDETCLNLDGSSTNHGGCTEAFIYFPRFPVVGKGTCKTSLTSTLITGSTAAGEAFPPHIQYMTKAKTPEIMRLHVDICDNIHSWISLSGDLAFSHQHGIYGFKFPKRFLEISSRDLTSLSKDLITNPLVPFSFAFARLNALQAAVRHSHSLSDPVLCLVTQANNLIAFLKHLLGIIQSDEKEKSECNAGSSEVLGAVDNPCFGK
jgi:hypothetical protein